MAKLPAIAQPQHERPWVGPERIHAAQLNSLPRAMSTIPVVSVASTRLGRSVSSRKVV